MRYTIQKVTKRRTELENKLEDGFGCNRESLSELISDTGLRSGEVTEVDGSPILFCRKGVVGLALNVTSINFRCLKRIDFLPTALVTGGCGNRNRGGLSADGSQIWIG